MNNSKTKVIVAGATGFIGRNITQTLVKNSKYSVTGIWNKRPPFKLQNLNWVQADLTNKKDIETLLPGYDVLIQMASVTSGSKDVIESPHIHIADNAIINSLLMRASYDFKYKHFVLPSCSIIYNSSEKPHTENTFNPSLDIGPGVHINLPSCGTIGHEFDCIMSSGKSHIVWISITFSFSNL